jgi:DNA-directed RNA polymerase specialized sigma24 family protein
VDDLVQDAFTAFWRFYTPEKLARANGLGDILAYLKSCVTSAAAQAGRRAQRTPRQVEWDDQTVDGHAHDYSAEASALGRMGAQQLWSVVEACCNDEQDYVVARLVLLAGLKPHQVAERRPDLFPDVSDVYRVKRNLFDRLRRALR